MSERPKHPDSFFAFYPKDFFEAVDGYSNDICAGYLRAISKYRGHWHCEGLPDDDEYLRRICMIDPHLWQRCKGIIFGHFFKKENGVWHQARTREDYLEDLKNYQATCERTKAATEARMKQRGEERNEERHVVRDDEPNVVRGPGFQDNVTSSQPKTINHKPKTINRESERGKQLAPGSPSFSESAEQLGMVPVSCVPMADIKSVLDYFNKKSGKEIPAIPKTLQPIKSILAGDDGKKATVDQCKLAIDWCVAEWGDSQKMRGNISIAVIFKAEKFFDYAADGARRFRRFQKPDGQKKVFKNPIEQAENEVTMYRSQVDVATTYLATTSMKKKGEELLAKYNPLLEAAVKKLDQLRAQSS